MLVEHTGEIGRIDHVSSRKRDSGVAANKAVAWKNILETPAFYINLTLAPHSLAKLSYLDT